MKIIHVFTCCMVLWIAQSQAQTNRALPSIGLKTLKGESISSDSIVNNGSPILIIVWATWCHHATDGMTSISDDYLDDWVESYQLKVVSISVDDSRNTAKVAPTVNGNAWDFEHYLDPNSDFKRAMGVNQPPHLFILNGKRQIVWSFNSFNSGDEEEIEQILKTLKTKKQ